MVIVTTAIVAHRRLFVRWHQGQIFLQIIKRESLEVGMTGERIVQISHIRLMVFGMMNIHRARIDVRLEGVFGVWQGWQSMGHGNGGLSV